MEEERLDWINLPESFRILVASQLGIRDRLPLQLCSKTEYETVSHCPVEFHEINVIPVYKEDKVNLKFSIPTSIADHYANQHRRLETKKGAETFLSIFKNKHSRVGEIIFHNGEGLGRFLNEVLEAINSRVDKEHKTVLRVKKVDFRGTILSHQIEFMNLLMNFEAETLESITIEGHGTARIAMEMMTKTDQFKKAKAVSILPFTTLPIETFFHLHKVELEMKKVSICDSLKMIENFRTKPIPDMNFFTLTSEAGLTDAFREEIYDKLDLSPIARCTLSAELNYHVVKFSCHNPASRFLLKIDEQSVFGMIVAEEYIKRLTVDVFTFMDLVEFGFDWPYTS